MAPVLKDEFPEMNYPRALHGKNGGYFNLEEKSFYEAGRFVDQDFILMHTFPLLKVISNPASKTITPL